MMLKKLSILFAILFSITNVMTSKNKYSKVVNSIDSLLDANYSDDAPGCALIIAKGNDIIYNGARGIADVNTKAKIDENTVFNIASISKQFTACAILKLQELGKLSIYDNVAKFFPEFKSDIWKKVQLCHLMSHSSGVEDKRPRINRDFMLYINDDQCLEYMVDLNNLQFEPGTEYNYINPTFQILYEIIQRVSGMKFEDFQQKYLFTPANMTNVRYFSPEKVIPNMAHGYLNIKNSDANSVDSDSNKSRENLSSQYKDTKGNEWMEYDYGEETFFGTKADGGIYTSARDFLNWERALSHNKCISAKSKRIAYTPHIKVSGSKYCTYQNRPYTSYGYAWFIDEQPNRTTKIYHTGDNGGFQAYAAKYEKYKVNVIMLENRNDIDRWTMQTKIEKILLDNGIIH